LSFYFFARSLLNKFLKLKGFKIEGIENVPLEGPVIIACNHVSYWDPILVGCALPRQIFFMAKEELFQKPVLGFAIKKLGAFPVKRKQGDVSAIRKSLEILKGNKVLGIFPEGTRSKSGTIQEAMAGIALIMEKSKAPILPIKVYGAKGLLRQKRGNIGVVIGKPFYASDLKVPSEVENRRIWMANEIMTIISEM
jgi:1-acyl-sn-glycerol-3-phosphate acyltransferase